MSARASASTNTQRIVSRIPLLAISLAALALILLAGAPLGWRIGLLPLKVSFILITAAGVPVANSVTETKRGVSGRSPIC